MENEILLILINALPILGMVIASSMAVMFRDVIPVMISNVTIALVSLANLVVSIWLWINIYTSESMENVTSEYLPGIEVDWVASTLMVLFQFVFFLVTLFSYYYIQSRRINYYFTLIFSMQLGMSLVVSASHLFLIFIFWELLVVSGYILVIFDREPEAYEAGIKYLIVSSVGSLFMLFGIGLITGVVEGLQFKQITDTFVYDTLIAKLGVIFIVIGFGFTAGFIIFNQWLPDAHPAAPAPVSALLSGLLVKVGIYGIYRTFQLFLPNSTPDSNINQLLVILGVLTMLEGNVMVIAQMMRKDVVDFKRILAYSTTVHLGYLLLIVGINNSIATVALFLHIINHALAKGLLFLISGYLIHTYHTHDLIPGVGRRDKILGLTLFIGFMSLGGLPGTGGFISKLYILIGLYIEMANVAGFAGTVILVAFIMGVVNSAFAFGTYLWVLKEMVFTPYDEETKVHSTAGNGKVKIIFLFLSFLIILLGVLPFLLIEPINSFL